jgi:hypothetical protein
LSDAYERISRYYCGQLAYLAGRLESMKEGEGTVLDNTCLLFLSNMWSGSRHDSTKVPVLLAGNLGGSLETGRVLDYGGRSDGDRKLCDHRRVARRHGQADRLGCRGRGRGGKRRRQRQDVEMLHRSSSRVR